MASQDIDILADLIAKNEKMNNEVTPKRRVTQWEHNIQVACINWIRCYHPEVICYAIPNGGARDRVTGGKMKAEGVLAGIPDLHIPEAHGGYHSLYIEMKNGKAGRLEVVQKQRIEELRSRGNKVVVVRDYEQFIAEVESYINS